MPTREAVILDYLHKNTEITLEEASKILGVSSSTTRRVFNCLQGRGQAFRTHGGIKLIEAAPYSFEATSEVHRREKQAIGSLASGCVQSGDVLYLDCGTTLLHMCRALAQHIEAGRLRDLQVFTNSIANLEALAGCTAVNLVGGAYRPQRRDFAGFLAKSMLADLHFTRCFLGTDGIGSPFSAGATDFDTADLNRQVIGHSNEVFVLCDASKLGRPTLVCYAKAGEVHWLVTDESADADFGQACTQAGVQVLHATPD